jgi:hypothetical protein
MYAKPSTETADQWCKRIEDYIAAKRRRGPEIDANILTCTSSMALRSDLAPEQRAKALQIGRIGFASTGARRKPKESIAG